MNKVLGNKWTIVSLLLPGVLLLSLFIYLPLIVSSYYGLTDWTGINKANFIGLDNFKEIIRDPIIYISLKNTAFLAVGLIFIQHPISLVFAVLLDNLKGITEKIIKVVFFIPCVISTVVTTQMFINIFRPNYGLLNKLLDIIGLDFLMTDWLGNKDTALFSIIIICIWQGFGWAMLIYYSGVKAIPTSLYEAAKIDGASWVAIFKKIIVPLLAPVLRVNITLAFIAAFKQMAVVYLTTRGGPGNQTQFIGNYLYIRAFKNFEYGYGNALSIVFVIVCLLATVLIKKLTQRDQIEM